MDWSARNLVSRCIKGSCLGMTLYLAACTGSSNVASLPYYQGEDLSPSWLSAKALSQDPPHQVGAFSLEDQAKRNITEADLDGKIVLVNFFFTRCGGVCPTTMSHMKNIQTALASDPRILLLSFTVDPETDNADTLSQYAKERNISTANWRLVTGSKEKIYEMARHSFFADKDLGLDKSNDAFLHTETFYLLDGDRRIRGLYNGTQSRDMSKILEDVRLLEKDKGKTSMPS